MLQALLSYNVDLVAFALLGAVATLIVHWTLRRTQGRGGIGRAAWALLIALLALGSILAHRAGENARTELKNSLQGFSPTYALELQRMGHAKLSFDTGPDDPRYLQLIQAEKSWLKVNPAVNDIYTFRRDDKGLIRFIVDSETDYNGNGVYDEEREQRTAIGEVYAEPTEAFLDALDGKIGFDAEPYSDRWGTWVTATYPIVGDDGKIEGAVGVDFNAQTWITTILLRRAGILGFCGVAMTILIWAGGIISLARHEISRRREAEETSRQSRVRLQTILDHEPEGIIVCSADGAIRQINPSGLQLLEIADSQDSNNINVSSLVDPQSAAEFSHWRDSVLKGRASEITTKLTGKRGTERWVNLHGIPLHSGNEPVSEILMVVRDITAARAAEMERERLQNQLVDASRQAGMADIATGVLHNVGNVLNTVNISSHLLTDKLRQSRVPTLSRAAELLISQHGQYEQFFNTDDRGKQFPEYLNKIAAALRLEHEEMLGTIRSLSEGLDHIKAIVQSQQTFATNVSVEQPLRPAAVFEEAVKLNVASCERHHVNIDQDFADLPPIMLDKHKTLQVLINLISNAKNAIKHGAPGERRIVLRLGAGRMNDVPSVRFEVIDNGAGIPPENLARIFGMGFTTRKDGHGFGLHSSANYAKEMGGTLTVRSEGAGKGASFVLELPIVKSKVPA